MSNSIWQSDIWGEDKSDFYGIDEESGFLKTVRIRTHESGSRAMLTQLFYPSGAKHSEHVFQLRDETQDEAVDNGIAHLKWLTKHAKRL